jgi:hypothetical protein
MTRPLQEAFEAVSQLSDDEQDRIALRPMQELDAEARWSASVAGSQDVLRKMAEQARDDFRAGTTEPLDPETL